MISESQAKTLLAQCESDLGRPLTSLRHQLRASDDTLGALWELITLHAALQLGKGVDHEPQAGRPDVLVDVPTLGRFWIEATHVRPRTRDSERTIREFLDWAVDEMGRLGIEATDYNARLDPLPGDANAVIAPTQSWSKLRTSDEWQRFLVRVQVRPRTPILIRLPSPFRASLSIEFCGAPNVYKVSGSAETLRFRSSGYCSPTLLNQISEHPIYRAIASKADQARRWKLDAPIVICVGSSLTTSLFRSVRTDLLPTVEAIVDAALLKTCNWSDGHRYNRLRETSTTDYQVRGSSRISGVLLASFEDASDHVRSGGRRRAVRMKFLPNREARFPLSADQTRAVLGLDFNTFPYGPQSETWEAPSSREWKDEERIMKRQEPGRHFVCSLRPGGGFELEIPAEDLTRLLLGVDTADTLAGQLRDLVPRGAGHLLPRLEKTELLAGNAMMREPAMLKFTFGASEPPLVQSLSKGKTRNQSPQE